MKLLHLGKPAAKQIKMSWRQILLIGLLFVVGYRTYHVTHRHHMMTEASRNPITSLSASGSVSAIETMDPESFEEERRSHGVDGVADGNNWKTQQADDGALRVDDRGNSSALPFPDDPQPGVQHGMLRDEEGDAGLSEMLAAAMGSSAGASSFGLDELHVGGEEAGDQGPQKQEESQATRVVEQHPGPGYLPEAEAEELRARGWDPTRPSEVSAFRALQEWLHPGPDVQARPESEYGTLVMTRPELSKRGAFFVPKVDSPEGERIWPPPDVKLAGQPNSRAWTKEWNHARGHTWRKMMKLLPDEDIGRRWKFESCAVVGNGGSLLLYNKGNEINAHEAVFRFNRGVVRGFEGHVGNRTTIRIVNRNNIGFMEPGDETVLQQVTAPDAFEAFVNLTASNPSSPVYGIDTEFHRHVLDRYRRLLEGTNADLKSIMGWKYQGEKLKWDSPATNGFYGVSLALQRCRRVSVYGFARSWGTPSAASSRLQLRYHYFDEERPIRAQQARDNDEFVGLASLVRVLRKRIRFGEPCIASCSGKMIDSARDPRVCPQCPPGSWCVCNTWHAVPRPGYCFSPHGSGGIHCFYRCKNSVVCRGGALGICPGDSSLHEPTCAPVHHLGQGG